MRRVCVVITARASYARIKTALAAIQEHPELELQVVVAASALLNRYGDIGDQIADDGFPIAARVYMVIEGENLVTSAKSTGLGLIELATVFDNLAPDIVVTIADRYETLATAAAAAYSNIPLAHIQGGEVTGSVDEKVRHAVTKLADLHLVANEQAADRVIRMGERRDRVFVTGGPDIDLAAAAAVAPPIEFDIFDHYGGVGPRFDLGRGYVVVLQHPVTTAYRDAYDQVTETLHAVNDLELPAIWFWPNVDAGSDATSKAIRVFRERVEPQRMHFFRNMPPADFLRLIRDCSALIGNSSVAIREGSFLGVPAVDIGDRQTGRQRGSNVAHAEYDRSSIAAAAQAQIAHGRFAPEHIYGDGASGGRVADVLARADLSIEKRLTYDTAEW